MTKLANIIQTRTGVLYELIQQEIRDHLTPRLSLQLLSSDAEKIEHAISVLLPNDARCPATWVQLLTPEEVDEIVESVMKAMDFPLRRRAFDFIYKKQAKLSTLLKILHGDAKTRKETIGLLNRFRKDSAREDSITAPIHYPDLDLWAKGLTTLEEKNLAKWRIIETAGKDDSWWVRARREGIFQVGLGVKMIECKNDREARNLVAPYL
jgi:hypothetical protein